MENQEINKFGDQSIWASGKQKYRARHIKISGNLEIWNQVSQVDQVQHLNKTDEFQINPTNFWSGDAAMFERRAFERIECAQKVEP